MFSTARVDRAVMPATNRRRTYPLGTGFPASCWGASVVLRAAMTSARGSDVQSDENTLGVREVSDDPAHGLGQTADQRRHGEDLIPRRALRVRGQGAHRGPAS